MGLGEWRTDMKTKMKMKMKMKTHRTRRALQLRRGPLQKPRRFTDAFTLVELLVVIDYLDSGRDAVARPGHGQGKGAQHLLFE